jgi:glucan phosphoethanolaminetransferase (alkaline phosphatase superfamily)
MSVLFYVLFFSLGLLLSFVSNVIGVVQGFQEIIGWGFICLLVPFGGLIFLIKFWSRRQWLRRAFWMHLVAFGLIVMSFAIIAFDPDAFKGPPFNASSPQSSEVAPATQP